MELRNISNISMDPLSQITGVGIVLYPTCSISARKEKSGCTTGFSTGWRVINGI